MAETDEDAPAGVAIVRRAFGRWANQDLPGFLELFDRLARPGRTSAGSKAVFTAATKASVAGSTTSTRTGRSFAPNFAPSMSLAIRCWLRDESVPVAASAVWSSTRRSGGDAVSRRANPVHGCVQRARRRSPRGQAWGWLTRR